MVVSCILWSLLKVKGMYLYSAVSSPLDRSMHCTLHPQADLFTPASTGKHSSHAAIMREDYSLIFPPPSIARYSFIQLSELRCRGENGNAQIFGNGSKGDSNPGYLDCDSGILPQILNKFIRTSRNQMQNCSTMLIVSYSASIQHMPERTGPE